jgi:RNA polymerase sigma-70 factor (ECF subfamily)
MEELPDEQLIERYRAQGGSPKGDAFLDQLFKRHHARVAGWCFRMTGNIDAAADLAQDVFLKAFQNMPAFRGDSKFTTWLYTIARNRCFDQLRSAATQSEEALEGEFDQIADSRIEEPSSTLERQESEALMKRLIRESLDETETQVLTLHYAHELPLDVVTRSLGLTNQSGAKAYVVSARRKLSKAFERWRGTRQLKGQ